MNKTTATSSSKTIYRSRNGVIFGVCAGLAKYANIPTNVFRFAIIAIAIVSGLFPMMLIAYILAAIFMKLEPVIEPANDEDLEFYHSVASSKEMAMQRLKKKFEQLERRTCRMEAMVTTKEFEWEQRFNSGT